MNAFKVRLIEELRDKNYRDTYGKQHVNAMLAAQISTIREQRGLTQTALAESISKQQPAISRIENVNYARWNVETLRQLASALGCWLDIRFRPWGELVEYVSSYSMETLRCHGIEEDPIFFGSEAEGNVSEAVRWMQRKVLPWLRSNDDNESLTQWLKGLDLPAVGDAEPPYVWITKAVLAEPKTSPYRELITSRTLSLWSEMRRRKYQADDIPVLAGVFNLLAAFPSQEAADKLKQLYDETNTAPDPSAAESVLPAMARGAYLSALVRNQVDRNFEPLWLATIRNNGHAWLPANVFDGFEGLKWLPLSPRTDALAKGLKEMYNAAARWPELGIDFTDLMYDLKHTFIDQPLLGEFLWYDGSRLDWQSHLVRAWANVFAEDEQSRIKILRGAREDQKSTLEGALAGTPVEEPEAVAA